MEDDNLPPLLRGDNTKPFVFNTIQERWPTIVGRIVDHFHCKRRWFMEKHGNEADADVKSIIHELSEIRYKNMTNKALDLLTDDFEDIEMWNTMIKEKLERGEKEDDKSGTWFYDVWLFVECYLYRRLFGSVWKTQHLKDYDMFAYQKNEGFDQHADQIKDALVQLKEFETVGNGDLNLALEALIKQCLWGNRCDLSLSGGAASVHSQNIDTLHERDHLLVVNHLTKVVEYLSNLRNDSGSRRIDFVLDNAGMELMCDLLLAHFLLSQKFTDKIVFHMKKIPWFVSDVTMSDWKWTLVAIKKLGGEGEKFAADIEAWVKNGTILLENHIFWTSPHAFYLMKVHAPVLYQNLKQSKLLIFKGDLNYRKLVGDRDWSYTTPFETTLRGFHPAPLVAFRALKAETVCGISKEKVGEILAEFGTKNDWLVSGTHAVIQMYPY